MAKFADKIPQQNRLIALQGPHKVDEYGDSDKCSKSDKCEEISCRLLTKFYEPKKAYKSNEFSKSGTFDEFFLDLSGTLVGCMKHALIIHIPDQGTGCQLVELGLEGPVDNFGRSHRSDVMLVKSRSLYDFICIRSLGYYLILKKTRNNGN